MEDVIEDAATRLYLLIRTSEIAANHNAFFKVFLPRLAGTKASVSIEKQNILNSAFSAV